MAPKNPGEDAFPQERELKTSALVQQLRDVDFVYLGHPAVAVGYLLFAPLLVGIVAGFALPVMGAEALGALGVSGLFLLLTRWVPALSASGPLALRLGVLIILITLSQAIIRPVTPDFVLSLYVGEGEPGPVSAVIAFAGAGFGLHHLFLWLLFMVLVGGSVNYRRARTLQRSVLDDIVQTAGIGGVSERELAQKQRDSVQEISRRVETIEAALADQPEKHAGELAQAVRELRQEVVRPSLDQLNALVASARATPSLSESVTGRLATVPWRWQGMYFSGTVGALLIGTVGLLFLAPTLYYYPGNLIQLVLVVLAFFLSVPAALTLFLAAALTPIIAPESATTGGWLVVFVVVGLAAVSFLQRFNRVRQVRAVESISVLSAQVALDQVRRAQDLGVLEQRINSILHGSVQSTLLALELGLENRDVSVAKHSREALKHLKEAMAALDSPTAASSESFERALANIVSVWAGSLQFSVDQSPEASDALEIDHLAASAVIEVVKEGTQNAVKHSDSRSVRVVIGRDGPLLRVRVSHPSAGTGARPSSEGMGLRYLSAITRSLRLMDDGVTTTLYAEIPTAAPATLADSQQ